jgi:hypothetical protein
MCPFPCQASYLLHLSSLYRSKAFVNGSIRLPDARTGWWWHRWSPIVIVRSKGIRKSISTHINLIISIIYIIVYIITVYTCIYNIWIWIIWLYDDEWVKYDDIVGMYHNVTLRMFI